MPWNNNLAEYAFKHFAKYRENFNGVISDRGLNRSLLLLSLYETCNNKSINFYKFLLSKEKYFETYTKKYTLSGNKKKIRKTLNGLSIETEIEHHMISSRTKEALKARTATGVKLGIPEGPDKSKLDKHREEIIALLKDGSTIRHILQKNMERHGLIFIIG